MRDYARNIAYCLAFRQAKRKAPHMAKQLSKQVFGIPSLETASRIDDSDAANAACAAQYRFQTRMREIEGQFEAKASELRAAFLAELAEIQGSAE
jgi:hypothetical protein